jgi:hypothetical protein
MGGRKMTDLDCAHQERSALHLSAYSVCSVDCPRNTREAVRVIRGCSSLLAARHRSYVVRDLELRVPAKIWGFVPKNWNRAPHAEV